MSDRAIPDIPHDAVDGLYPPGGLLASLRVGCGDWLAYVDHGFVRGLADGSLPEPSFRHYLVQDYLFLIHFARAYALAAYKGETVAVKKLKTSDMDSREWRDFMSEQRVSLMIPAMALREPFGFASSVSRPLWDA